MKSTGIVRKVDELGRIVIPIELRRNLGIGEKEPIEIYVDGESIILKKYEPGVDSPQTLIRELLADPEQSAGINIGLIERMYQAVQ